METDLEKVQRLISGLTAKAERTDHPKEAATFYAAAEELMLKYNLGLEKTANRFHSEEIVRTRFSFSGPALYWRPWMYGATFIVQAIDRVAMAVGERNREFILYGTEADVEYVERLLKSAWRAAFQTMKTEIRNNTGYLMVDSVAEKSKFRKSFIEGFGVGVAQRIRTTHDSIPEAALVLARRKNAIEEALAADGVALQAKTVRSRTLNRHAFVEGYESGNNTIVDKTAV